MQIETSEQALRREAIRRRLQGELRGDICRDLERATSWFDKWWAEYRHNPQTDFADRSRAPHTSPHRIPAAVERAVVTIRQHLEAADTPDSKYGLIGNRAIHAQLEKLELEDEPSLSAIQRILVRHGLTHAVGAGVDAAYYPWPIAWAVNAIHATDIITRHVQGGEAIQNFHTIDHASHAAHLTQRADKTSAGMNAHLLETWAHLGLPAVEQLDNEGAFCGGHTHPRVIGQVVRLCLFCNIEVLFTPIYEAKRNYQIETFHSLWDQAFWSRQTFRTRAHVQNETPTFVQWYHHVYQPPRLQGQTPAQRQHAAARDCLTPELRHLIPSGRLPITTGRFHLMRKVDAQGYVTLLNEPWQIGTKWIGEYVRATIHTAIPTLTFWHQADADAPWRLLKKRAFRLKESVQDLLPTFQRKRTRCLDYWPG